MTVSLTAPSTEFPDVLYRALRTRAQQTYPNSNIELETPPGCAGGVIRGLRSQYNLSTASAAATPAPATATSTACIQRIEIVAGIEALHVIR
jgi:hypothetical protein